MKEYQLGNVIVCVSRPVLTDEERTKREDKILSALQQFGKNNKERGD